MAAIDLEHLYGLHVKGELDTNDPRWLDVQKGLRSVAVQACNAKFPKLCGEPMESLVGDVEHMLLRKFVRKKLNADSASLATLLRVASRNDAVSASRTRRSVISIPTEMEYREGGHPNGHRHGGTGAHHHQQAAEPDFIRIAKRLEPFRFSEFPYLREALLVYFLSNHRFPDASFIRDHFASPASNKHRRLPVLPHVIRAAIFDINSAMYEMNEPRAV